MPADRLTPEQVEEVRAVYKTLENNKNGVKKLAEKFGRTPGSLSSSASKMGITNIRRNRFWLRGVRTEMWQITEDPDTGRGQAERMYRDIPASCEPRYKRNHGGMERPLA